MATAKKTPAKKTAKAAESEVKPAKKAAAKKAAEPKAEPKAVKKAAPKAKAAEAEVKAPSKAAAKKVGPEVVEAKAEPKAKPAKAVAKAPLEAGLSAHAQAILAAIQEGRAVEFIFADADANAPRTFEPRQLTYDALSQAWFVWGWDRRYNAERFHRLDLLAEINPVEGVGRSAQGPYKEGTPGNQIGGWLGGEPIPVKVLLHKQWVFAVKQAPPAFPEFKLTEVEDGKAQVSFTATDLRAIARWVLQFGDGITIQEPARLLDRVKQVASVWLGKDAKPSAPAARPEAKPAPAPHRPEPRHEAKPEHRSEHRPERHREQHHREREAREETKSSNPKVEIRFDRL